ncbi:SDR family oxidoreductase [Tissierella creatinophila]|uniref:NAD(P)H azoreductase n=1 Tax=Tissierella creatinophila DSM 6911 TaxID=1123403 RepID=A0A1U7M783_TISCR|nr:SDR family oxidoreductase [Tissierella creatinophila]OLS03146.1 NAD(P)H azoreductase [Tissierella creatinophila DSM 6911]
MDKYLITGATGNIGMYVVEELLSLEKHVKLAVHDVKKAKEKFTDKENIELVKFDFLDDKTFEDALEGIKGIFLVRPPELEHPNKDMLPFLEAAKEKGVEKIVFVSLLGVEKNPIVPHRKIESMIKVLGIPYVFLRPSFFMQNLNTNHREEIRDRDELYIPAGKSKTSFIDTRDIARAAAISLIDEKYRNTAITLTGKRAIDYYEIAKTMSEMLERKIEYKNPSLLKFRKERIKRGTPKEFANVMSILYLTTKLGIAKDINYDLEKIIGREPISFRQYVIDHKNYWIK